MSNDPGRRRELSLLWKRIALIAGVFSAVLALMLLVNGVRLYGLGGSAGLQVVEGHELGPLKAELVEDPKNEVLKGQVREIDQSLRRDLLRRQQLAVRGGAVLVVSFVVMVGALQVLRLLGAGDSVVKFPPLSNLKKESHRVGRAIAGGGLALVAMGVVMVGGESRRWENNAALMRTEQSGEHEPKPGGVAPSSDSGWYPTRDELAGNWHRFRGLGGLGICDFPDIPTSWNGESGENVLWKVETGLPGEGSPVVWGGRIYLIGATEERREMSCFSLEDGALLWRKEVGTAETRRADPPEIMEMTGYAASTPVTDGRRVFAIFANGEVAGFTAEGDLLWTKWLGTPANAYGHAISLAMWRDRVIVQFDEGSEGEEGKSRLIAFDAASGEELWSTQRMVPNSWATPIVIRVGEQDQIITTADPWVIAYDPSNGKEIWRVDCLKGDVAPSPVFMNGLVYVVGDGACLAAIRANGSGDVTESHVEWKMDDGDFPDMCSLTCDGPRVYMVVYGTLHAFDSLTGAKLWEYDIEEEFQASPAVVAGRLYLLTQDGLMVMGEPSSEGFEETGRAELDEECGASPVFAPGRLILRGRENLYCIGKNDG